MSTSGMPPGAGNALSGRSPAPSINLIPPALGAAQANRALQLKALIGLGVAVLLFGGVYVWLTIWAGSAQSRVEAAEQESTRLVGEREKYTDLLRVQEQLAQAEAAEAAALGYELDWSLLDQVVRTVPEGSVVRSIAGAGMSATQTITPLNPIAATGVGRMSVELVLPEFRTSVTQLNILNATPGLSYAAYDSLTEGQGEDDAERPFVIVCTADVSLLGLTGKALPAEFNEWKDKQTDAAQVSDAESEDDVLDGEEGAEQ
jgi:Tfp pilus assembly protein PilN